MLSFDGKKEKFGEQNDKIVITQQEEGGYPPFSS